MLTAYFDDSGSHSTSDLVLWSGLFGNQHQWQKLIEDWRNVLANPCPNRGPIKRFHMTECQDSRGEFAGWKRVETDYVADEFRKIITACGLYGNGLAVARKQWDGKIVGDVRGAFGDAEGYCLRICYVRSLAWARQFNPQEDEIKYVFDRRPDREPENQRIFDIFRRHGELEDKPPRLHTVSFNSSYEDIPLQAADMVAWEMYQHGLDYIRGNKNGRPRRRQLAQLTRSHRIRMGIVPPETLRLIVAKLSGIDKDLMKALADHMISADLG